MMVKMRECAEFDHLWNERLDARDCSFPELDPQLAAHTAQCDSCRCRALIYADFAAIRTDRVILPPPSVEALARWQSALAGTIPPALPIPTPPRPVLAAFPLGRAAARVAGGALAAAAILLVGQALLNAIDPAGTPAAAPPQRSGQFPNLFEEACQEATEITEGIAREVTTPAAAPPSRPLLSAKPGPAPSPSRRILFDPVDSPDPLPTMVPASPSPDAGLVSGQTRSPVRVLGGSGSTRDEVEEVDYQEVH